MVKNLIIAMSAVFLLTYVPATYFHTDPFDYVGWFGLSPYFVLHKFYVWQLATYLFLHGGWFHIGFNLYALWMFGSDLEASWGGKKFLVYFFVTGIGAGILDVILNDLFRSSVPTVTIGCSGAVYGVLLAYGMAFPERPVYIYGIIPVKTKWFVAGMGAVEFVSSFGSGSGISHFAHLGGMFFGFLFLRGGSLPFHWQRQYQDYQRAQMRKKFEVYMRDQEKKDKPGRWVN